MKIKNHGEWRRYTPQKIPEGMPGGVMFAQRVGDARDWYDYIRDEKSFAKDSIKLVVTGGVVGPAVTEADRLFPQGATVLEIFEVHTHDPQTMFGGKVFDGKAFRDPPPKEDFTGYISDLKKRIEELEKKLQ